MATSNQLSFASQVKALRQESIDADITVLAKTSSVGFKTLTASRVATLPGLDEYPIGLPLLIGDESGNCSSNVSITVKTKVGATTVATLIYPYASVALVNNGVRWVIGGLSKEQIAALVTTGPLADALGGGRLDNAWDATPLAPTLDYIFTAPDVIPVGQFTRAGTALRQNALGILESIAANTLRIASDPLTGGNLGALFEEQRTNLLSYSEQLDNAVWGKTSATVVTNTVIAPDGTMTGDKIIEGTAAGAHAAIQAVTYIGNGLYAASCFVKAAERTACSLVCYDNVTNHNASFLLTGGGSVIGTPVGSTALIFPLPNGWYRCVMLFTAASTASTTPFGFQVATNNGTTYSYTGDGASGIYAWGAQTEAGAFSTSYITTTTAAVTRATDSLIVPVDATWFNPVEGTFFIDVNYTGIRSDGAVANALAIDDGTLSNLLQIRAGTVIVGSDVFVRSSNATTFDSASFPTTVNTSYRQAIAYAANDFAFSSNGLAVNATGVVNGGAVPIGLNRLQLATNGFNGYIRRVSYAPRRLANSVLQRMTL